MRLLLDTHIWLWSLLEPKNLTPQVAAELESPDNELWLSPISTWELLVLIDVGRVLVSGDPERWVREVLRTVPFREAPITHEVALESQAVGLPHRDPADRLLAATAKVYDLTLVTADERLLGSTEFSVLANRYGGRGTLPSALDLPEALAPRLSVARLALFLDYDGTLTPIVSQPEDAVLADEMRGVLRKLAARCFVAIVSGRDLGDLKRLVALDELVYAGSHGFDIAGPDGLRMEYDGGRASLPSLEAAHTTLAAVLAPVPGVRVERKRFALAVHYRNAAEERVPEIERAVDEATAAHTDLVKSGGKKILELRPRIDWDKGHAVRWLLRALALEAEGVVPIYVGDDVTDEDAFRALTDEGIGILVAEQPQVTAATYALRDTQEVLTFLRGLVEVLDEIRR